MNRTACSLLYLVMNICSSSGDITNKDTVCVYAQVFGDTYSQLPWAQRPGWVVCEFPLRKLPTLQFHVWELELISPLQFLCRMADTQLRRAFSLWQPLSLPTLSVSKNYCISLLFLFISYFLFYWRPLFLLLFSLRWPSVTTGFLVEDS